MTLNYLGRYWKEGNVNSENDAQDQKHERASRKFIQDFTLRNVDDGEDPISLVLPTANHNNTKVETVLEDNTNDTVDNIITCLSTLSIIPSATTEFMRAKLNLINISNSALTQRLGKLNLL